MVSGYLSDAQRKSLASHLADFLEPDYVAFVLPFFDELCWSHVNEPRIDQTEAIYHEAALPYTRPAHRPRNETRWNLVFGVRDLVPLDVPKKQFIYTAWLIFDFVGMFKPERFDEMVDDVLNGAPGSLMAEVIAELYRRSKNSPK